MLTNKKEYLFWSFLVPSFFFVGYLTIPLLMHNRQPISLEIFLDKKIPYLPISSLAYLSGYLYVFLPAFYFHKPQQFRRGALALLLCMLISFLMFIIIPVQVHYPLPVGTLDRMLLNLFWIKDNGWNSFPSLHCSLATIAYMALRKVGGYKNYLFFVWFIFICSSTFLTKKHYLADSIAGIILGTIIHFLIVEKTLNETDSL